MRCSARSSLRQQAQNLPPGGDCGGQFDVAAGGLAFGLGGFRLDAQPRRQVGLAEAERLLEEAACLSAQCGAALATLTSSENDSSRTSTSAPPSG